MAPNAESAARVQFPITRVCAAAASSEGLRKCRWAARDSVFTFTKDYLYDAPVQPTVMAVVDLDGGGRFLCQMTDVDERDVRIGMPVELVLRRMREGGQTIIIIGSAGRFEPPVTGASMKDKVAIIGVGCTKFGDQFDQSYEDMAVDAAHAAFADAGIQAGPHRRRMARHLFALRRPRQSIRLAGGFACGSMASPSRASRISAPPAPTRFATPPWPWLRGMYDVALVLGAEKLKNRPSAVCRRKASIPIRPTD